MLRWEWPQHLRIMAGALKGRFGQVSPEAYQRPTMLYICCIGGYIKMVFLLVSPQVAAKMEINHRVANDGIILSPKLVGKSLAADFPLTAIVNYDSH